MIKKKEQTEALADVGVIVGRFQTPFLHQAHKDLIQFVADRHSKVVVFIGLAPIECTKNNPLDFKSRRVMVEESFPDANVLYIEDNRSNEIWSRSLDNQIDREARGKSVMLYGGRDSFIKCYTGRFDTQELESDTIISATQLRKEAGMKLKYSMDFRMGVIHATQKRFDNPIPCVDVFINDPDNRRILLAKKSHDPAYRLVGGFVDTGETSEQAAIREAREETGLEVNTRLQYVGSYVIDDFRYRKEQEKILSTLYIAQYIFGAPAANDDIAEVKWFGYDELDPEKDVINGHRNLVQAALNRIKEKEFLDNNQE